MSKLNEIHEVPVKPKVLTDELKSSNNMGQWDKSFISNLSSATLFTLSTDRLVKTWKEVGLELRPHASVECDFCQQPLHFELMSESEKSYFTGLSRMMSPVAWCNRTENLHLLVYKLFIIFQMNMSLFFFHNFLNTSQMRVKNVHLLFCLLVFIITCVWIDFQEHNKPLWFINEWRAELSRSWILCLIKGMNTGTCVTAIMRLHSWINLLISQ